MHLRPSKNIKQFSQTENGISLENEKRVGSLVM